MTIRATSFDFDGSLFNRHYADLILKSNIDDDYYSEKFTCIANEAVIKANVKLLDDIKETNKFYSQQIIFVGSNRQSNATDLHNAPRRGSCYPAIAHISKYLEAELDPFLLADVYGGLKDGESYDRAMNPKNKEPHAGWIFDDSKVTVLYAQIQKIANQYPDEDIVFDFYDDRSDILDFIQDFFRNNSEWIPSNLTLRLHHYRNSEDKLFDCIPGQGPIDLQYRETILAMTEQAKVSKYSSYKVTGKINAAVFTTPIWIERQLKQLKYEKPLALDWLSFFAEEPDQKREPNIDESPNKKAKI